jgi:outer membrane protein OmpA-like peptidoglycan-associated protein
MTQGKLLLRSLLTLTLSAAGTTNAQDDLPAPIADPRQGSSEPIPTGIEENSEDNTQTKTRAKDIVSGTGFIMIVPHVDGGLILTKPSSTNIFSKIESTASGWIAEPKLGLGIFSKMVSLDLLAGVQISSLSGKIKGIAKDFEFVNGEVENLEQPQSYTSQQTVPTLEGNARIRLAKGKVQVGFSATALFGASKALYSSVPLQGLKYGVLVGPQFVFEERVLDNYFRMFSSWQFLTTGNQRTAMVFKFGGAYAFLLNSPYLTVTEKKITKSKVRVQKQIVTTREQNLVQNENVSFIFDSQMINFRFNSADLTEKSTAFVSGLGQIFSAQHSDWQGLVVEGHSDSKGNNEYNKKLSQRRAESVRNVLIQNGIPDADIKAIGYGEERLLINPEQTEVDFARNRRVEIKVQGMRDARILQRSITRLQNEIFGKKAIKKSDQVESQEDKQGDQ